jgi:amino acid adenylation domain-containing protein
VTSILSEHSATFGHALPRGQQPGDGFPKSEIEQPIHRRFARMAEIFPDRTAVRVKGASRTYSQLRLAARGVARALLELGGDRARPIGLIMEPGGSLFASMFGALEAGRFYIPIDPALGDARVRAVLAEADADLLVTDQAGSAFLESLVPRATRVLRVEDTERQDFGNAPDVDVSPDDLAYLLFTSGSTGTPKGVLQTHRNVLHNAFKLTQGLRLTAEDRVTLLSSCSVGSSVSDIYGALLNGAALCPFSLAQGGLLGLPKFIEQERITVYHSVPSAFRRFAATIAGEDLSTLRIVKLGGEAVLGSDLDLYRRHLPESCLFHVGLGATEMSVIRQWSANHETPCPWPIAPVGYSVDDTEIILLDEQGQPAAGDTGEIAVVSPTLSPGYWRRPDETAEAFRPLPGREGWRIYRTGDWGRLLPDGCLLYLGRRDSRVKVRGHRVELLEVEAELARLPGIREAAVAAREGPTGTRLIGYFVAESGRRIQTKELRDGLRSRLSEAMIPSVFVSLDALPLTTGGKLDRQALPAPESVRPPLDTPFIEPRGDTEAEIARLFAELLRLDRVGSQDDFFDLGGDSLSVIEAILRLEKSFGRRVSPTDFLESPTPAGLGARISSSFEETAPTDRNVKLRAGTGSRNVFVMPAGAGRGEELLVNARLARRFEGGITVFALRAADPPLPNAETLALEYVERIRSIQPKGPYVLVGECVGGILAFEMARVLVREGERVALLALLDTPFPTAGARMRDRLRRVREPWGDNLVRRMQHHQRALAQLPSGRLEYLLTRARSAVRALASLRRADQRRRLRRRSTYVGSLLRCRPQRFDGAISFIESAEGKRQGHFSRWASLASNARAAQVPGDHDTYIREHVDSVAEALGRWLGEIGDDKAAAT